MEHQGEQVAKLPTIQAFDRGYLKNSLYKELRGKYVIRNNKRWKRLYKHQ